MSVFAERLMMGAAGGSSVSPVYIEDVFSTFLYTGNGSSQSIPNGIKLGNGATSPGWIALLGGSGGLREVGNSVAVDFSGNVYVCGESNVMGDSDWQIAKYNTSGVIQWQRNLRGGGSEIAYSVAVDSSGNVYVSGATNVSGSDSFQIVKYNTSGIIQWQRALQGGAPQSLSIAVDSSGNVYACGYSNSPRDLQIVKYNTSGTIQWQRRLGGSGNDFGYSIAVDSSGNVYVTGSSDASGSNDFLIAKYNTSGVIQWQRRLGSAGADAPQSIAVDSSGNVYVCGYSTSGTEDFLIAKYDTSGTIQWQRRLGGSGSDVGYSIAVDSSGNVYVCGYSSVSGTTSSIIAKYNTSGTIQWQRRLVGSGSTITTSVAVDSSGNVYVCGYLLVSGNNDLFLTKLPGDGSGTGAYNVGGTTIAYDVSNLTDAVSSLTDAATSLTDVASTLSDIATTHTDAATTLNSSTMRLVEGAGLGGLVWMKGRSSSFDHALYDTARGATFDLVSNSTAGQTTEAQGLTGFLGSGFSIGSLAKLNTSSATYASWTFAKQPKFFDVVTYTGDGVAGRTVAHNLGSVPGCIIVKRLNDVSNWHVYHRSLANSQTLFLNTTAAATTSSVWESTTPTSTVFTLGSSVNVNGSGSTYVAYLFAHNAGGFGASGTDNVISCGSVVNTGNPQVTLGYEPQWVLFKSSTSTSSWYIVDNMRGLPINDDQAVLLPNSTAAEVKNSNYININATGFTTNSSSLAGETLIYVAIRRGPMRTPTSGTSVYLPDAGTNGTSGGIVPIGFPVDLALTGYRSLGAVAIANDRLRGFGTSNSAGVTPALETSTTGSESAYSGSNPWFYNAWNTTITRGSNGANPGGAGIITWFMRRAPGFFDVVCYTGTGSTQSVAHNLGVVPELMIFKIRNASGSWYVWSTYGPLDGPPYSSPILGRLELSNAFDVSPALAGYPSSTTFTVGSLASSSASTYVAYLFASCPGVSKVGNYTGNGSSQTINCGFTAGARFVMIKRTDSTGNWYIWDTARGIVAANDPHLSLNSGAAEVTTNDSVDPESSGFIVNQVSATNINVNGATYIYLAIA